MNELELGLHYSPAQLLPQRHGMLLVDEVGYGRDYGEARLTIRKDSAFCDGVQGVPGWVGIEYMAQAVSAYSGVELVQQGLPVRIGLLIGTRSYDCAVPCFGVGTRLHVLARIVDREDGGINVFACQIGDGESVLARADLKAYRPDDIRAFLGTTAS